MGLFKKKKNEAIKAKDAIKRVKKIQKINEETTDKLAELSIKRVDELIKADFPAELYNKFIEEYNAIQEEGRQKIKKITG